MKKTLLLFVLCLSVYAVCPAQSKMNFALVKNIDNHETDVNEQVPMLIQGNVAIIEGLVTSVGGRFKFSTSNIASVSLSINELSQIISNAAIKRVEAFPAQVTPLNDSVLVSSNIIPALTGQAPLSQIYDGTGVVMGIIDTGIDFTHPDFQDASGKTRILWLWDQTKGVAANTPAPYGYGQEWSNTDIDIDIANGAPYVHSDIASGHGTHVTGTAAGNGLATGKYMGVAPKADIIFVAYGSAQPHTVDAIKYIYNKAKLLGKPCVINASYGGRYGLHDGRDLECQAIKTLINQNPGQAFVAAGGNSGVGLVAASHLEYTVSPSTTNFTLFAPSGGRVYMDIVADSNDLKNIQFAIGADKMTAPHSFRGNIPFLNVATIPKQTPGPITTFLVVGGKQIGKIQYYLDTVGGDWDLQFYITPDSTTYDWRLMATGTGKFDLWNYTNNGVDYAPIVASGLTLASFPDSADYKYPDLNKSIEGGFQCMREVITVGCVQNINSYIDCLGNPNVNAALIPGKLAVKSSIGPSRDGRIKPDLVSPGELVMSCASIEVRNFLNGNGLKWAMAQGCMHFKTGGTSHSAPSVSGVAALYLQKNPTATADQVKQAILGSTYQDVFTGHDIPNNYYGYGKLDGFGALVEILAVNTQPVDQTICENSDVTFSITATGAGAKTYLWQEDKGAGFVDLTNVPPYNIVTANTLTITAAPLSMNGYKYRCLVHNTYKSDVTSDSAILILNPLPTIGGTLTVCEGTTTSLTGSGTAAVVNPWISSNTAIATVSSSGIVTGIAGGTSTISYTNSNGCVATATLTVNALPTITGNLTICEGSTTTLTGSATAAVLNPWTSSIPAIATVSSGGIVTGVLAGNAVITYTNILGCSQTTTVTVNALPTIGGTLTVCKGATTSLTGSGIAAAINPWVSSNIAIATITSSGIVTGMAGGTSTISYTNFNGCVTTTTITVNASPTISGTLTTCEGSALTLAGSGTPDVTTPWSSSNTAIATISSTGVVAGISSGNSTITYTEANGCSQSVIVTIYGLPTISGTLNLCEGGKTSLSGSATAAVATPWISANTSIATVSAIGVVTAVAKGSSVISYTNSHGCVQTTTITVETIPVVTFSGLAAHYCFDDVAQNLTGTPADGTFSGTGITNAANGTFDPMVAGAGVKTITYTYNDANNCGGSSIQSTKVLTKAESLDSCKTNTFVNGLDENISNIFTPNGDGINDEFKVNYSGPPASDYNLSVYDRWGSQVFTSINPNVKWDGRTLAGIKVSAGTYYYVLVNSGKTYKGYVSIYGN